jgi:hypothetical protein
LLEKDYIKLYLGVRLFFFTHGWEKKPERLLVSWTIRRNYLFAFLQNILLNQFLKMALKKAEP